jgi:CubicO group peptidase (beta-lactamase class C family)
MKSTLKIIFLFILLSGCRTGENTGVKFPAQEQVTSIMNEAMEKNDLPAVVAIASNINNEEVSFTYGKAIWTEDTDVTENHIFKLWSMTKLITSVAALQLVEQGKIGLDDDLKTVLPEMSEIPVLSNGQLTKPKKPITLKHLLTHTSGFGYGCCTDLELSKFDYENWEHPDAPRRFESGTQFLYGTSLEWVGKVVEKISNSTLEDYFKRNITEPLKMERTFFNVPDSLQQFIVSRGNRGKDGKQPLTENKGRIPKKKVTRFSGDDGLWSTPNDYMQILKCLLNYGTLDNVKILNRETVVEMIKNQIGDINMESEGNYFNPEYCCDLNGLATNSTKWGLAWAIDNQERDYGRKPGTVYWGGMMNTFFYIDYKSGVTACIFTQHIPFNHSETTSIFDKFSEIIYSEIK